MEKIRAISSMDMKHVFIAGTWTGIFLSFLLISCISFIFLHNYFFIFIYLFYSFHTYPTPPLRSNFHRPSLLTSLPRRPLLHESNIVQRIHLNIHTLISINSHSVIQEYFFKSQSLYERGKLGIFASPIAYNIYIEIAHLKWESSKCFSFS